MKYEDVAVLNIEYVYGEFTLAEFDEWLNTSTKKWRAILLADDQAFKSEQPKAEVHVPAAITLTKYITLSEDNIHYAEYGRHLKINKINELKLNGYTDLHVTYTVQSPNWIKNKKTFEYQARIPLNEIESNSISIMLKHKSYKFAGLYYSLYVPNLESKWGKYFKLMK